MTGSTTLMALRNTIARRNRSRRPWLFPLLPAGLNVAGMVAIAAVQLGLRLASRVPFSIDAPYATLLVALMMLPLLGSALAARGRAYGLAALLAGLAAPASLVAAFVAFGYAVYATWAGADLPLVSVDLFLAAALFLLAVIMSVVTGQACLGALRRQSSVG
jgi:hypothetical protein